MSKKILITVPHPSFHGGVGHIYRLLNLNQGPDVEYFYNTQANKSANPAFFISMLFRFVKRIRNIKIVHLNPSLNLKAVIRDGMLLVIAKLFHKRTIVFFHGWEDGFEDKIVNHRLYRKVFRWVYNKADVYLLLGNVFSEKLTRLGVLGKTIYHLPTIAENNFLKVSPVSLTQNKTNTIQILFIAGFVPLKGMDIVLHTLAYLVENNKDFNFELTMAGDGPELKKWMKYVADEKLENVKFTGYISGVEKHNCFTNADILFLPSASEGLPCVIMEGMLYGLAIVTRPVGAIPDWVKNNINGVVADSTDPKVFADGIVSLLEQPDLLNRIKQNNHDIALKNFTPDTVKTKLQNVYKILLNGND